MLRSVCSDGHGKGYFEFYGANRTGRFAGRLVQLQNLPHNHMETLSEARALVRAGKYETLKTIYDGVSNPLSELLRTALIPEEGHQFLVADFSAIEARVIAWFADEKWRLDVFNGGGDIYCSSASQMFKVPVQKHGVNGHLRQKGKVAELACIAEGQPVLTDQGLLPIEQVTAEMRVWDGENWVTHEGLIYRGEKEVITYDGLTATPDHLVWIEGKPEPVRFDYASSCGARLLRTGDRGAPLRVGRSDQPGKEMEQELEPLLRSNQMHGMRDRTMAESEQPATREIERLSAVLTAKADPALAGSAHNISETTLRESEQPAVSGLRGTGDQIRLPECDRSGVVCNAGVGTAAGQGDRQNRHERQLCSGESAIPDSQGEQPKQESNGSLGMGPTVLALRIQHCNSETVIRDDTGGGYPGRGDSSIRETEELARYRSKVKVYDLRNAGPYHRFTVSGVLVHNCGYGGGVGAMKAFGADKMGLNEEEMQEIVDQWREASPKIVQMWWDIGKAAARSISRRGHVETEYKGVSFDYEEGILWMNLPS